MDRKTMILFALLTLLILAGSMFSIWPIRLIEGIVDLALVDALGNISDIIIYGVIYITFHILGALGRSSAQYLSTFLQTDTGIKIQNKLYEKLLRIRLGVLQGRNSIELTNALIEDTEFISNNLVSPITKLFSALVSFGVGMFFMLGISWQLTLIILPCGLVTSISARIIHKKSGENIEEKRVKSNSLWKIFTEGIRGIIPIRVYRYNKKYGALVSDASIQMKKATLAQEKLKAINLFFVSVLFMATIGIILVVSSVFVIHGIITVGALAAILMYNHMLIDPLIDVLDIQQDIIKLNVSLKRVQNLFTLEDDENLDKGIVRVDSVTLEDISFSYINSESLFSNINISVSSPCNIWIKGGSGSGKTTLANIIAGLYPPTQGCARYYFLGKCVDGVPNVSYLIQDGYLFDKSIVQNIMIANPKITDDKIEKLINICHLSDVIENHGHMPIGENGSHLSGGERKRVRIAQMLANDSADIYIFDELTSSLDEGVAFSILKNISSLQLNKICLYIEHNTKVAPLFDRVIVVDGGHVWEQYNNID